MVSTEYGLISNAPKYLKQISPPPEGCSRIRNPEVLLFAEGDWNLFSEIKNCRVVRAFTVVSGGEEPQAGREVCADASEFVTVRCVRANGSSTSQITLREGSHGPFSPDSGCL